MGPTIATSDITLPIFMSYWFYLILQYDNQCFRISRETTESTRFTFHDEELSLPVQNKKKLSLACVGDFCKA